MASKKSQRSLESSTSEREETPPSSVEDVPGTEETMEGLPGPAELTEALAPAPNAVELPPTPGLGDAPSDVVANVEDTVYVAPASAAEQQKDPFTQAWTSPKPPEAPVVSAEMPPGVAAPTSVDGNRILSVKQVWPRDADNRVEAHFIIEGGKDLLAWTSNDGATWSLF